MNRPRSPRLVRRGQRGAFAIIMPWCCCRCWHLPAEFGGLVTYDQLAASAVLYQ